MEDSWLKYLLHLIKVDDTSGYLMYKNFEQTKNENEDECLRLGRYAINAVKLIVFNKVYYVKEFIALFK